MAKLVSRLMQIIENTNREVSDTVQEVAEIIRDDAKANAPRRTGRLRRGIRKRQVDRMTAIIGILASEVPYAGFVHWGTSRQMANPFLLAAFVRNERLFQQKLLEAARRGAN